MTASLKKTVDPFLYPSTLLLGGGLTLSLVAKKLKGANAPFIITNRSPDKKSAYQNRGYQCELFDFLADDAESFLTRIVSQYGIETIVDSIPPPRVEHPELKGSMTLLPNYERFIRSLRLNGIKKIIYLSTTGVFGRTDGSIVDESTVPEPRNAQARARWQVEEVYRETMIPTCILRIPAIYGEGRRSIVDAIRAGQYPLIGDGSRWTNRIHVEDLSQIIFNLVTDDKISLPSILAVGDDQPVMQQELLAYFCRQYELPLPSSIDLLDAFQTLPASMLGNQRVSNGLLKQSILKQLKYPNYRYLDHSK